MISNFHLGLSHMFIYTMYIIVVGKIHTIIFYILKSNAREGNLFSHLNNYFLKPPISVLLLSWSYIVHDHLGIAFKRWPEEASHSNEVIMRYLICKILLHVWSIHWWNNTVVIQWDPLASCSVGFQTCKNLDNHIDTSDRSALRGSAVFKMGYARKVRMAKLIILVIDKQDTNRNQN